MAFVLSTVFLAVPNASEAGVFNLPRFVDYGQTAVGFEPEAILSSGAGVGANIRYTQGISDVNNFYALVGMGSGVRKFRIGGGLSFDFIPDVDTQPGIGIGTQAIYYRYDHDVGQLEVSAVPYIHKSFGNGRGNTIEPFFALPFGPAFNSGNYHWQATVVLGAIYHQKGSAVRFISEVGVNVNKTESYISGGILYQP
jgi:hypothetical protein